MATPREPLPPFSRQVSDSRYCYLAAAIGRSKELRVGCAGRELCDPNFQVSRAGFPCFGLEFVAGGTGRLVLRGRAYPLHSGVMFSYGPGIPHQITTHPGRCMTKYFVDFWGDEAAGLLRQSGCAPGHATQIHDVEGMRALFGQLIDEGTKKTGAFARLCAALLRVVILKAGGGTKPSAPDGNFLLAQVQRWQTFIEANYPRLHALDDIAREMKVRPSYLCRMFKRFGKPSPFRYLTRLKLNRAADLLVGARLSVKAAAFEVGYTDPYHFSRLFKAHLGCSPSRFLDRQWRLRTAGEQEAR